MKVSIDKLSKMYVDDGLTTRQIAAECGLASTSVSRWLRQAGVAMRPQGSEPNAGLQNADLLRRLYVDERKSTTEIAQIISSSVSIVSKYLKRYGIEARSTGSEMGHDRTTDEARLKMSLAKKDRFTGSDNPNWKGGTLFRDPERNRYRSKMWVKAVKDRDGWKCTECPETDNLHAHHIKRWRDYPALRYDVANGVTLCHSCHEAAHGRGFKFRWRHERQKTHECTAPAEAG